jgi:hypothetical protein
MTLDVILFELARLLLWPVSLGVVLWFVYAVVVLVTRAAAQVPALSPASPSPEAANARC